MSKVREAFHPSTDELGPPLEGELSPYVVFSQLSEGGEFRYAGWLDAVDETMALGFACEHYGQDQECVALWVIPRSALTSTDGEYTANDDGGPARSFIVFVQKERGGLYCSRGEVVAASGQAALDKAVNDIPQDWHGIWVAPLTTIIATHDDDVIWRETDQTYRLARGYSKTVREKWEKIRSNPDLVEYEKEDLKETF